ncbi:stress responsive alpha/beta barrel protein [Diaminobutyricimonas aerilata]|uniref:Stress responsive alpha/beta barrel protein n=1 Tax=Diaminobutyricimonas aerilata TaxID=1162967 RepID=A0A2M9CGD2_9MICO|nr:Dabb family protein [Diaminobutyricimonas aerilata]PJJ70905.1 stress responsive alpha/beta barrel protein [Diaminobutyricimonas aerilata]
MIRHVVTWKLRAVDEAQRDADAQAIVDRLRSLVPLIPEIKSLEVARNTAYPEQNWHVVLIADFDDLDGLETYQQHPAHLEVVSFVRSVVAERASVDFEAPSRVI